MTITDIVFKNLLRRKTKAGFILAGLVIGVATVIAVITFVETMAYDINHKLEKYGANILIVPRADNLTLSYGGMNLGGISFDMQLLRASELAQIKTIKNAANIAAVGPIVLGAVQIKTAAVLLAGVDFEAATILKPWWKINGKVPHTNAVLLGVEAARVLALAIGDSVTINDQLFTVAGVLAPTGSQDDQIIFTRLETAQTLLNKPEQISMVEVAALCNACPIDDMVSQIAQKLPSAKVMAIQQVVQGRMETLGQIKRFSIGLSIVVVIIGALVVLVTMMGSVKERTKEIGIFRAIGFRRAHVMRIFFMEASVISLLAGASGYLLGAGSIWLGMHMFSSKSASTVVFDPMLALDAIIMAVLVGLSATAYPAVVAARMDPNHALKTL